VTFKAILKLEIRETLRQPLSWAVFGALLAAMLIGSIVGARRVEAQRATIARVSEEAAASVVKAKAASAIFGKPGNYTLAQFRDPTDAYGYKNSFLIRYAVQPPAALATLSAGQSDLQPNHIRVNFQNVFSDSTYELKSPRILALGAFDLGFVLVYLVPLAVIALGGTRLSGEQDSGILRMIAAQPIAPAAVATAKFLALALVAVPLVALAVPIALLVTGGVGAGEAAGPLLLLMALVALYTLFWIAACALVASFWRGAVTALATLVLGWAAMTVLLPSLAVLLLDAAVPSPSRIAYVDESRVAADRLAADTHSGANWFAHRPDLVRINPGAAESPEVARLAREDLGRTSLLPLRSTFQTHQARIDRGSEALRLISPAMMLDGALQSLAGTDVRRQQAFVIAAADYVELLRGWFDPRIVANIGAPLRCTECPGRMTFADYDAVPAFVPASSSVSLAQSGFAALYLALITVAMGVIARRRYRAWPL